MTYTLALMVLCPMDDDYKLVSHCKKCSSYKGLEKDELLKCSLLGDPEIRANVQDYNRKSCAL